MNTNSTPKPGAESISINRRRLLTAAAVAPALAVTPALASANPDAAIIAAWERRKAAYARFETLPFEDAAGEAAFWATVDAEEEVIRSATARTPRGVMIQILVALNHTFTDRETDEALQRGDLASLAANEQDYDWSERMTVAALRSLEAMGA